MRAEDTERPQVATEDPEAEVAGAEEAPAAAPVDHEARAQELLALAQRTQADFENFRKRAQRDNAAAEQRGTTRVVRELLPALDNLDRAIAAATDDDHFVQGVRLVQAELTAALARVGVEGYSPEGEAFDPTVHEAIAQQPVEGAEAGTVAEVLQPGYRKDGAVIRPARVVVAA